MCVCCLALTDVSRVVWACGRAHVSKFPFWPPFVFCFSPGWLFGVCVASLCDLWRLLGRADGRRWGAALPTPTPPPNFFVGPLFKNPT